VQQTGTINTNDWNYSEEQETCWGFAMDMGILGRAGEIFAPREYV